MLCIRKAKAIFPKEIETIKISDVFMTVSVVYKQATLPSYQKNSRLSCNDCRYYFRSQSSGYKWKW